MTGGSHMNWAELRRLALRLHLPGVKDVVLADGNPALYAHARLWTWWDRGLDAPGFRCSRSEREFLIADMPEVYFIPSGAMELDRIFARPDLVNPRWVQAILSLSWRAMAPDFLDTAFPGVGPKIPALVDP